MKISKILSDKKRLIAFLMLALILTVFSLMLNRVLFPLYRNIFAEDITVELIATGAKNDSSVGNNVRLSSVAINGTKLDLGQISFSKYSSWKYMEHDDFIYNYEPDSSEKLTLELKQVLSAEFSFVSEIGSGEVQIHINGKEWKTLDLYSDSTWDTMSIRYNVNGLIFPEKNIVVVLLLLFVFLFIISFIEEKHKWDRIALHIRKCIYLFGVNVFLSAAIYGSVHLIQFGDFSDFSSFLKKDYLIVWEGYIFTTLILCVIYCITKRFWLSYMLLAFSTESLVLISVIKNQLRGTPLLPWDFSLAGEALSVVDGYQVTLSPIVYIVIIANVCIVIELALFNHKMPKSMLAGRNSIICRILCSLSIISIITLYVPTTIFCGTWGTITESRFYQPSKYYAQNGFIVAFTEYFSCFLPQKEPDGYNEENIYTITEEIIENTLVEKEKDDISKSPNIIAIMSESFWDISRLENVQFFEDPLPVYSSLKNESKYGNLLSHVFGGNTVTSEFEFLTAFDGSFISSNNMVYGDCLFDGFESAVSILEKQGYNTMALHPYIPSNYNRNRAFEILGFDKSLFEDDFNVNASRIRGYISDYEMYQKIINEYEIAQESTENPLFLFGISMQNHGGYWKETTNIESQVDFSASIYSPVAVDCMNDYFSGLHASDAALGELISYFRNVDEETIIIIFGDHVSDAGPTNCKMLSKESWYDSASCEYSIESHIVPFIVWNNKSSQSENWGLMNISELFPSVLYDNGISMPYFWNYVRSMNELYAASNNVLAVNSVGEVIQTSDLDSISQRAREMYRVLQYDYIYGKKYSSKLWGIPE